MNKLASQTYVGLSSIVTSFALGLAVLGCGGPPALDPQLRADLQTTLDKVVANKVTPGVVLHVSGEDGTWDTAAGVADVNAGAPATPDDRFRAGSIMKTFVATAVLQAVEKGDLNLDDVLTDHLPASVTSRLPNADTIDVAMLLDHRSGIPEWVTDAIKQKIFADPKHVWTLDDILGAIAGQPPLFNPGAGFFYSNTDYVLLGEILSAVEKRPWRDAIREQIIARAGLDDTTLPEPGDIDCPSCARGYVAMGGDVVDTTSIDPSMAGASGGHALVTSSVDLARLLDQLRAGALFDHAETLEKMFDFTPAPDPQLHLVGYGFGVMRMEVDGNEVIGHIGSTAGYQSFMLYVPATRRYVSGFMNVTGDLGAVLVPILDRVAQP